MAGRERSKFFVKRLGILGLVLAAILVIGLVGAGTFAYFSDSAQSTGNSFTSGTLDMELQGGTQNGDSVIGTWVSPANWAPGQSVSAALEFNNKGTINSNHVYFMFSSLHNDATGDGSNMMNAIIVTNLQERFNGVTTSNQAATIDSQVGNHDGILTLAEFLGFANGWYGYYTYDDKSGDGVVLAANNQWDYDLILGFTFDAGAGNNYQGDSCSFSLTANATQNSPTEGLVCLHQ